MTWPLAVLTMTIIGAATFLLYLFYRPSGKRQPAQPDTPLRDVEVRLKAVEMEWQEFYTKVRRALGRFDRDKFLEQTDAPAVQERKPLTRSDLLKHGKGR